MALCVRLARPASTASVVEAMARVDVLHKQMAAAEARTDEDDEIMAMSPFDDYYMAGRHIAVTTNGKKLQNCCFLVGSRTRAHKVCHGAANGTARSTGVCPSPPLPHCVCA